MAIRIDVVPVALPGLRVWRWSSDQLYTGLKERYAIGRVERGNSAWWTKGKVWTSGPGSVVLKQPDDVHRDVAHDGAVTMQVVTFAASEVEQDGVVDVRPLPSDARAFRRMHDAIDRGADRFALEVVVAEAIGGLRGEVTSRREPTRPVSRTVELLREKLDTGVTLDELAAHAGLDKFRLCRAFRAHVGLSPHAYLTRIRIARAKALLERGVRPSAIAPQVGLYDQSLLNRHFRRIVGTTPARWQQARCC